MGNKHNYMNITARCLTRTLIVQNALIISYNEQVMSLFDIVVIFIL